MDKHKIPLTILISFITTAITVGFAFGSYQEKIETNCKNITKLQTDLATERSDRKDEYTQIQIELAKIDTNLEYIKKALTGKE